MIHHHGNQALELLVLRRKLKHLDVFLLMSLLARVHPVTGKIWSTTNEIAAAIGRDPEWTARPIARLKRAGVITRLKQAKVQGLPQLEQRLMPDPSSRGPHSGRLFFLIDPLLASVGGRLRRAGIEEEFLAALNGGDTPLRQAMAEVGDEGSLALGAATWTPRPLVAAA
ncbi:hypothetical protein [Cyanobium sp. ULC084]